MATEDREMMEGRGAGESCPTFPKMVPDDPMSEGKSKASLAQEAESPKPDSSYDYHEEMETCEDRGCPGPPKSLSSKAGPATTKGQEGDGPERAEPPLAPAAAAPGTPGPQRNDEMELEKMRMEFELERLWYLQEENERQRQHEEVMEQLRQQATPRLFSGGLQDLLLPQNQFAMFLYCFIFIHIIYVTKEMVFFLFSKHYLFCIVAMLLCLIKTLWQLRIGIKSTLSLHQVIFADSLPVGGGGGWPQPYDVHTQRQHQKNKAAGTTEKNEDTVPTDKDLCRKRWAEETKQLTGNNGNAWQVLMNRGCGPGSQGLGGQAWFTTSFCFADGTL
ncbi:LOW QUALITY PROTEIN: transmembrane protein 247 [Pseudorca crassidens]|uniref:LOW QUALITY PROTEIN: transmembrane protein 247 n=1 Tax=Pseudorca crassidens TaxID=82174 RepID=UPI00352F4EAC